VAIEATTKSTTESPAAHAYLRGLYDCRLCATENQEGFPAPPHGRLRGVDILLVGWNPQARDYPQTTPGFEEWRQQGETGLERASGPFEGLVGRLLPDGYRLDDGRVCNTRVWKWPSADKARADQAAAERCANVHLWAEALILRPKLILTYDSDAANFFARAAVERGIPVHPGPPEVRPSVVKGWTAPSAVWGWPMGLLLVTGLRAKLANEVSWIRSKGLDLIGAAR
jgi:hypothetical protein